MLGHVPRAKSMLDPAWAQHGGRRSLRYRLLPPFLFQHLLCSSDKRVREGVGNFLLYCTCSDAGREEKKKKSNR